MNRAISHVKAAEQDQTLPFRQSAAIPPFGCLQVVLNSPNVPDALPIPFHNARPELSTQFDRYVYIGRSRIQNTYAIDDKCVSRQHAILSTDQGQLHLRDNGSLLGTFLNGRRLKIEEVVLVQHGDLIGFGPIMYCYQENSRQQPYCESPPPSKQQNSKNSEYSNQEIGYPDSNPLYHARLLLARLLTHNSKLQFFGYNVGNLILAAHQMAVSGTTHYGVNLETSAAIVLLIGSICAWQFHPAKRPYMLLYNGLLIIVGGLLFYAAGYPMTGIAMIFAALEVARGGLAELESATDHQLHERNQTTRLNKYSQGCGEFLLAWYILIVEAVTSKFYGLGRFINERPFIMGPCIQLPVRIGFIGSMGMIGNWAGVVAGLLWTFLGDGGLALHDARFKSFILRRVLRVEP